MCEECNISKAGQKNVKNEWKGGRQVPGERLYIHNSSLNNASYGESKFWLLIVNNYTEYCWSFFQADLKDKADLKNMADMKDWMVVFSNDLKVVGIEVKYIRCDGSCEKKAFYSIKIESPGSRTPQLNGMFSDSLWPNSFNVGCEELENEIRSGVWSEFANTVIFLFHVTYMKTQDICHYHCYLELHQSYLAV